MFHNNSQPYIIGIMLQLQYVVVIQEIEVVIQVVIQEVDVVIQGLLFPQK